MHTIRRALTSGVMVLIALALLTAHRSAAQAPSFATIYSFKGGADGSSPNGVTFGENGSLYGTTYTGGTNTCDGYLCGTIFALTPAKGGAWTKTVLFDFNGADGALPSAKLAFGSGGALYGTTETGGSNDSSGSGFGGTVFELAPPSATGEAWTETVLYSFSNNGEAPHTPLGGVIIGPSGALYGTTDSAGGKLDREHPA